MWTLAILLAALFIVHHAAAMCNTTLAEDIKGLNIDNENTLRDLDGEYRFVYLSIPNNKANETKTKNGTCLKLRFLKEGEVHKIEYVGVEFGKYTAELVDGVIQQKGWPMGREGKVDMFAHVASKGPEAIAFYTCSNNEPPEPSLTFIAVSVKAQNAKEKYKKAMDDLEKVGIKIGVEMPACIDGDGDPVGEGDKSMVMINPAGPLALGDLADDDDNEEGNSGDHLEHEERALNQKHELSKVEEE